MSRHVPVSRTRFLRRLNRLAASPWTLGCTSFVLTALLMQSNGVSIF